MTPEIWTTIGVGFTLSSIEVGGFTLLWRYIAAVEKRSEDRSAAVERRGEARFADLKADLKADVQHLQADLKAGIQDLKADNHALADRLERNHADLRHAIDILVLTDQAKRLTILEEAVLRTVRPPDDREARH